MKAFIEISVEGQYSIIALSAIAAITKRGAGLCVITFNQPIPALNTNEADALLVEYEYSDLLEKMQAAAF